jgi:hypothetical protein
MLLASIVQDLNLPEHPSKHRRRYLGPLDRESTNTTNVAVYYCSIIYGGGLAQGAQD